MLALLRTSTASGFLILSPGSEGVGEAAPQAAAPPPAAPKAAPEKAAPEKAAPEKAAAEKAAAEKAAADRFKHRGWNVKDPQTLRRSFSGVSRPTFAGTSHFAAFSE